MAAAAPAKPKTVAEIAAEEKKAAAAVKAAAALKQAVDAVSEHFLKKYEPPTPLAVNDLTRFCIARMNRKTGVYDVPATIKMLSDHLEWRSKTFPLNITPAMEKALTCGKMVRAGVDRGGRPIILIVGAKWDATDRTQETHDASTMASLVLIEQAISDGLASGPNWDGKCTVMYDRTGYTMSHSKVLLPWVKSLLAILQANYPERLHVALLHPINWLYNLLWGAAQYFFDPVTASKLTLLNDVKDFQTFVDPNQLFVEYSGTVKYVHKYDAKLFAHPLNPPIVGAAMKQHAAAQAAAAAAAAAAAPAVAAAPAAVPVDAKDQKQAAQPNAAVVPAVASTATAAAGTNAAPATAAPTTLAAAPPAAAAGGGV